MQISLLGQPIDGPENGQAPAAWDIPSQASELFKNETRYIEVPHTASVKVKVILIVMSIKVHLSK